MKLYRVAARQYGIGDGKTYKHGARLREDQISRGRLAAGLRLGHLVCVGEEPAASAAVLDQPAPPSPAPLADEADTELEDQPAADVLDSDPLDGAIGTLAGVDGEALAALAAAELLCIGDAVDYLAEHKSFIGLAGIGKGRDKQLQKALAQYLPAAAP